MTTEMRVLIFGLPRDANCQELLPLLGPCRGAEVELMNLPDDSDAAYAVVHVLADRAVATRVAQGINARRFHGRPLQSWVTAMAWA
jgi:hypothetical protein